MKVFSIRNAVAALLCACAPGLIAAPSGCARDAAIEMASIDRVEPAVIEQGDVLRIHGSGFVEGEARITLSGEFDPSGLVPPERRVVVVDGVAVSGEAIEVPITGAVMRALAAETLRFDGRVSADFPSALQTGPSHIGATSGPVTIEVRPAGSGVASAARRTREAEQVLARLGISLVPSSDRDELLVGTVASGKIADRAGLAPGDRLVAVDGVALSTAADLAGLAEDAAHRFELVSGSGLRQVVEIKFAPADPAAADEVAAIVLTALALGLLLALLAPRGLPDRASPALRADTAAEALSLAAVAIPVIALPAMSVLGGMRLAATGALFAGAVGGLVLATLFGARPMKARLAASSIRALALAAVPALALMLGTAFDAAGAVADQEGARWSWVAWRSPFSLLALIAATALLWPADALAQSEGRLGRTGALAAAVFSAVAIATYGLGGWSVPFAPGEGGAGGLGSLLCGIAIYAIKTWTVLLAARALAGRGAADRRRQRSSVRRSLIAFAALLAAAFAALAWEWAQLPGEICAAARLLSAGVFFALVAGFWTNYIRERLAARRERERSETTAPELG